MPVGRVGVGGADGKGTRGNGLRGGPCEQPQARMAGAGEVTASNLEIAAVDVALMESDITVVDYFPCGVAP